MPALRVLAFGAIVTGVAWLFEASTGEAHRGPPLGVTLERAFPRLRFERPVFLTGAGDGSGRLFVLEQDGVIRTHPNEDDVERSAVFLDIREQVSRKGNEEGLLGLAFPPDFAASGAFYVHYSSSVEDRVGVVARFLVDPDDPDRADPDSEAVVLRVPQPYRNHNGGMIAFGPDGMLYASFGDGGAANDPHGHGQDRTTLLGTIVRLDVSAHDGTYAVPPDNPFVGATDGSRPEIWAYGLRNVWRFAFDRETGVLWAADIGQGTWEEIDVVVRGGNYGWNTFEADERFALGGELASETAIGPVAAYGRTEGMSVTGGSVYRGSRHPALWGRYFYADYVTGNLWSLPADDRDGIRTMVRAEPILACRTGRSVASFGEDDAGELYLTSFDGGIHRLVPADAPAAGPPWPERLSETGLFADLSTHALVDHVVPYEINMPFWSDGATKWRAYRLPEGQAFTWREHGTWEVPVGTTLLKTFRARHRGEQRSLETRLIERTEDGWEAATYVWADDGSEAWLMPQGKQFELRRRGEPISTWHAPSASECRSCHVESAGFVLGLTAAQLDRGDQLRILVDAGHVRLPARADVAATIPHPALDDETVAVETRARAWLDVNCAMCHRPAGTGNAAIDLRVTTPLAATGLVDEPPAQGDLGLADARLLAPGAPERSVLWHRVHTLGDGRMPNLASNRRDEQAVALLHDWISSLD